MLSKSLSAQQLLHDAKRSAKASMRFEQQDIKKSYYQKQMKKYYDELNRRAEESIKRDRQVEDYLNDWNYCNPANNNDELPMPYRAINEIIEEDILSTVWVRAREIEKYKLDPSYDASLPKLLPSGEVSSIPGISAVAEAAGNPMKHLFLGDRSGNIFILDQNKKSVVAKFDQLPRKRVTHISASCSSLLESCVITIAVIQRASNKVNIFRYTQGEIQLNVAFTITVGPLQSAAATNSTQQSTSAASKQPPQQVQPPPQQMSALCYPFQSSLSINATYLSLSLYSGNVSVYKIPEPPLQRIIVRSNEYDNEGNRSPGDSPMNSPNYSSRKQQESKDEVKQNTNNASADGKSAMSTPKPNLSLPDLSPFYTIEFKGRKREKKHAEIMKTIKDDSDLLRSSLLGISVEEWKILQNPIVVSQQQPEANTAAPLKKDTKKPSKVDEKKEALAAAQAAQPTAEVAPPEFFKNKEVFFSKEEIDAQLGDVSEEIALPVYLPIVYFLNDTLTFSNKEKTFNQPYTCKIASGLVVAWMNTKNFQYHKLNNLNFSDIPTFLQYASTKKEDFQQPNPFTPSLTQKFTLIYPISCMQINGSQKYLSFGFKDGNTLLWDNEFRAEKRNMAAHSAPVSCLQFFHEKFSISGCRNGEIIIQSLEKEADFKRIFTTFQVTQQNAILAIEVNKYGLVQVLDSKANVRTFNVHLGEKIAQLIPQLSFEKQTSRSSSGEPSPSDTLLNPDFQIAWQTIPQAFMYLSQDADQLYLLNEEIEKAQLEQLKKDSQEEEAGRVTAEFIKSWKKRGVLQVFKLVDNLTAIYEGIKSLKRNGVDNNKIIYQFSEMNKQELTTPDYTFPIPTEGIQAYESPKLPSKKSIKPGDTYRSQSSKKPSVSSMTMKSNSSNDENGLTKPIKIVMPAEKSTNAANTNLNQKILLPSLSAMKDQLQKSNFSKKVSISQQQDDLKQSVTRSAHSTKRSFFAPSPVAANIRKGLTEQKLHPEKYLWKSQYQSTEILDPLCLTLTQARERISNMYLLENNLSKSMVALEKSLKQRDEERLVLLEQERRKQAEENQKKKKAAKQQKLKDGDA